MRLAFLSRSLRTKIVVLVLLTTLLALLVALVALVGYDLRSYHRNWVADISTQAELLGRTIAPALSFDDATAAKENLELLHLRPQVQAAAIYNARGALFASFVRSAAESALPALPEADGVHIEGRTLVLYSRIVDGGEILGTVYLRTDYELAARLADYLAISFAVLLMAMLVAWLVSERLQKFVTGPMITVSAIAREVVAKGDFSRRADKLSSDEVGELVESFNGMLNEIERRTQALESANSELARQMAERDRAEQEIQHLNAQLETRVRERTTQLQAANLELEAFCYSVSHDLRAPLRSIDGFSQALIEDFPADVPPEALGYLGRIRAATVRMGQLIEDLLNLSRVSRGGLERKPVDISEIARQIIAEHEQREPLRRVEVAIREGMHFDADPRLVRTALENLIGNAWKFTSRTVAPRIEVGSLRDGNRVSFFVRDNGAGFDMAYVDNLFGAFQRLHSANEFSGTGIGLATVQRIVHRHGGRIWADAQVGKGAAFYFTLAFEGAVPAPEPVAPPIDTIT